MSKVPHQWRRNDQFDLLVKSTGMNMLTQTIYLSPRESILIFLDKEMQVELFFSVDLLPAKLGQLSIKVVMRHVSLIVLFPINIVNPLSMSHLKKVVNINSKL